MYDGWPLAQIAQVAPEARILVMLRDPVDRYASGYARENRLARERGEEGISPAMVEEPAGSAASTPARSSGCWRTFRASGC